MVAPLRDLCQETLIKNLNYFKKEELEALPENIITSITQKLFSQGYHDERDLFIKKCSKVVTWIIPWRENAFEAADFEVLSCCLNLQTLRVTRSINGFMKKILFCSQFSLLQKITLSDFQDNVFDIGEGKKFFSTFPSLRELILNYPVEDIGALFEAAASHGSLEVLEVHLDRAHDLHFEKMRNFLKETSSLRKFSIYSGNFSSYTLRLLADGLQENKSLVVFEMVNPKFHASCTSLVQSLVSHERVRMVNIMHPHLFDEGEKVELASSLTANPRLLEINMPGTNFVEEGALCQDADDATEAMMASFSKAISRNCPIQSLNISCHGISLRALEIFFTALAGNNRLLAANLSENGLPFDKHESFFKALETGLKENQTLVRLDLSSLELGNSGCFALAAALRKNRTLTHLDISANNIGQEGIKALMDVLDENQTIAVLNLRYNNISAVQVNELSKVASKRTIDFGIELTP